MTDPAALADDNPTPCWQVIAVFDPDERGGDFAYTVGLHDLGRPELLLWARPTDGLDPGADWKLSPQDACIELNRLARSLLRGDITTGSVVEVDYDAGLSHARLTLTAPVPRDDTEAHQADPLARVSVVRWELDRPAVGPRRGLTPSEANRARAKLAALVDDAFAQQEAFDPDGRFGPHTSVIDALRDTLLTSAYERGSYLVPCVRLGRLPNYTIAHTHVLARTVGLPDALEEITRQAGEDAQEIAQAAFDEDDPHLLAAIRNLLVHVLTACYSVEAIDHAFGEDAADARNMAEVLWCVTDPDGARAKKFMDAATDIEPRLKSLLAITDVARIAPAVADLDDDQISDVIGMWPLTATAGLGSGLWIDDVLPLDGSIDDRHRAAVAIAAVAYRALLPDLAGDDAALINRTAERVLALVA